MSTGNLGLWILFLFLVWFGIRVKKNLENFLLLYCVKYSLRKNHVSSLKVCENSVLNLSGSLGIISIGRILIIASSH